MKVELIQTVPGDQLRLSRLMQLYAYDFSEFMAWDLAEDAVFHGPDALSLELLESWRHPYLLRAEGHLAGFAILDERSRLTGDTTVMDVGEFFVLRKYRRQGIGSACAALAFDLFPRKWEVCQVAKNSAATAFWRKAILSYTGGRFQETLLDDERWRGPVQSFDARRPLGTDGEHRPLKS